jgi:zinc protease
MITRLDDRYIMALTLAFALGPLSARTLGAQRHLDRAVLPTPGPSPKLQVPTWVRSTLSNGAQLVVVEKHDLPLVAVDVDFIGGATTFEPAGKVGLARFAASMLSEGTATRTADQLSDAEQMLGTSIGASVGPESGSIGFTAMKDRLEPALALLTDMLLHSTDPPAALDRLRARSLVELTQSRDKPDAIASNVFSRVVYGDQHPYGRVVTEQSLRAITRDDVVAFQKAYFQPSRAVITVAGDVDPRTVRAAFERALASWPSGGDRPNFAYGAVPAPRARTIFLIDKPGAAQSVFAFGTPGPARNTPDYFALQVMNMLLGGLFQSRLNHDIREVKGFSYGVFSGFSYGRGPGAFRAGGGIVSTKTDSALMAFMQQFRGVQGTVPFTDDEIMQGKAALIQSLPGRFASVDGIARAISAIYTQDLPESYYRDYAAHVNAVTRDDLVRVAKRYIDVDHMDLVIVGDRATIEAPLRATGIAPITVLDVDGRPLP